MSDSFLTVKLPNLRAKRILKNFEKNHYKELDQDRLEDMNDLLKRARMADTPDEISSEIKQTLHKFNKLSREIENISLKIEEHKLPK